jgi:hypothetical protein
VTPVTGVIAAPQPWGGHVFDVTLIADAAVPNPVLLSSEQNETGDLIRFIFRQSGAGSWDLTWGNKYAPGAFDTVATATGVEVVTFMYDGTLWVLVSSAVAVA